MLRTVRAVALTALVLMACPGAPSAASAQNQGTGPPRSPLATARSLIARQEFAEAVPLLEAFTAENPDVPGGWVLLGYARHSLQQWEAALEAHIRAAGFPQSAPTGAYNAAMACARLGRTDEAFDWLEQSAATGRIDMTQVLIDPDALPLLGDDRLAALLPGETEYTDSFVEPIRILHEWRGEAPGDQFGWIARDIGDVDGDGAHDLATSAPTSGAAGRNAGRVYAYSGRDGRLLWQVDGPPGGQLGLGIEAAGDVDADGVPDVIAGAPYAGRAFVYSGIDGTVLRTFSTDEQNSRFGRKVSDVGDVDGDGHADVFIGDPLSDVAGQDAGRAYLYSGRDGSELLVIDGERPGDQFGSAGAGSVDDGRLTLVIGAPGAGEGGRGRTYVYNDLGGEPAFIIESDEQGVALGAMFVSVVGDVDADGVPDVYASDWAHAALGANTGRVYVHSGADGRRLFTLTGETAGDGFGIGPADAGDVDGDGHDDLVIGAWQQDGAAPSGGAVYLYSGRDAGLLARWTGKVMGETFGFDATGIGDVDGDGMIDLLLTSAWSAVNGGRSGRMFVISTFDRR